MPRHPTELDKKQFENLCGLQCTKEEVCSWFEITDKTLEAWCKRTYGQGFSEVFAQKRGKGKISLRRAQFQLAQKNASMAIFLGKNYLGQKDHPNDEMDTASVGEGLRALADIIAKPANDRKIEDFEE